MHARQRLICASLLALSAAAGAAVVFAPLLPRGTDVYPHVLWSWQVLRCLAAGDLPVWLPDLNAGFGSPGIRLYSPFGPLLSGALGLLLGDTGRGMRAALALAVVVLFVVVRKRHPGWLAVLLALSPAVVFEALFRFPVSQLLALPLAWALLDRRLRRANTRWEGEAALFALLWLVHAPTAMLVVALAAALAARRPRDLPALAAALATAALLTTWQWLPLWLEAGGDHFAQALTAGELHPLRNLLGARSAHLVDHNIALGWAAVALLAALLVGGVWRSPAAVAAASCVFMASLAAAPIWANVRLLAWLQFPWRWLVPASILVTLALAEAVPRRRAAAAAIVLAPLLVPPPFSLAADPRLGPSTPWPEAGRRVSQSFAGNPFLVDVDEHRPAWWGELGPTMAQLGGETAVLLPAGAGSVVAESSRPTERSFRVVNLRAARLVARVLFDGHWEASVDGENAIVERWGAATSVALPPGSHSVRLRWTTDIGSKAGATLSALTAVALLALVGRRRYRHSRVSAAASTSA